RFRLREVQAWRKSSLSRLAPHLPSTPGAGIARGAEVLNGGGRRDAQWAKSKKPPPKARAWMGLRQPGEPQSRPGARRKPAGRTAAPLGTVRVGRGAESRRGGGPCSSSEPARGER